MSATIAIRITESPEQAAVVRELRAVTPLSVADIAKAIEASTPISVGVLFGRGHAETEVPIRGLLAALEGLGATFDILVNGAVESKQYLLNRITSYHQIAHDTRMEIELELGEPSPEAEKWGGGAANDG